MQPRKGTYTVIGADLPKWVRPKHLGAYSLSKKAKSAYQPLYVGDPKWRELFLLPPNAMKVWLYHYSRENERRESWPSLRTIAKECRISRDTVIDARAWLKEYGWLIKVREIEKEENEFQVPVFRVEKGTVPEFFLRTGKSPATSAEKSLLPPAEKSLQEPVPSLTSANEPVPTLLTHRLQAAAPRQKKADPRDAQSVLGDDDPASILTRALIKFSGHWIWKKNDDDHRLWSDDSFRKLLFRGETLDKITAVMEWASLHPHFSTGLKTINKEFVWEWFVRRYDEMVASAEADAEFMVKMKKRLEDRAAAVSQIRNDIKGKQTDVETDPMFKVDVSGSRQIVRKPRTVEERRELLAPTGKKYRWDYIAPWLSQDNCPTCHGQSFMCSCTKMEEVL